MTQTRKKKLLEDLVAQAVPETEDLWPSIQARVKPAPGPVVPLGGAIVASGRSRRRMLGLGAAAALVLALGLSVATLNQPQAVSAQTILDRAEQTTNGAPLAVTSYHLLATRAMTGKGSATTTSEVWYGGSDRQRFDETTKDASGQTVSSQEVVFNGAQTWIATTEKGQTIVIHTTGTTWNNPVDDPAKLTSLADVLQRYGEAKSCLNPTQQGEATVVGRKAYVVVLTPKTDGCASARPLHGSNGGVKIGSASGDANQIGQATFWVDEQSFLPLKTEVRNSVGLVLESSEVTSVQYNVAIPAATFAFTPPAGTAVYTFNGGDGGQVKATIARLRGELPAPAKAGAAQPSP